MPSHHCLCGCCTFIEYQQSEKCAFALGININILLKCSGGFSKAQGFFMSS